MSIFDQILGAAQNHPEVKNMADKLGIDQAAAENAIAALGEAHHVEGDTVEVAASKTGMDAGVLNQIMQHVGGEGALARFNQILDADGDGNPFDDIAGFAGKLFGKN